MLELSASAIPTLSKAMKSPLRFSKASGSTKRRVERMVRLGERATKRALSSGQRSELAESLDYGK